MAMLLRKVWGSVSTRSNSSERHSTSSVVQLQPSLGAFDQIPCDIFLQILKFLGPREAAKLSVVCKSWKFIVSDNRLWIFFLQNQQESWDAIFFAETQLRSGYPLQTLYDHHLSFMQIYGQRSQITGSVIIDGGSGYCKYGWSRYARSSGLSATFLEFGNIESPMYSRLRHFFSTIYSRMQVKPSTQPIVVSIPICHYDDTESAKAARRQLKEAIYSVLFDMNVPAATLALYAARHTSGIVVNIGFHVTSVVPILQGKVMREVGVEVVGQGALKLTGFLREMMQQKNINFESSWYTVCTLKENLCYVAADYEAELSKDTHASFEIMGEGWFTLSKERFQTGEVLFQPRIGGVSVEQVALESLSCLFEISLTVYLRRAMGLHQAVALCMDHCQAAEVTCDDGWFKTVVLTGGTACLPGLPERLEKELSGLLPPSVSKGIRVIPPPYGAESAWFGAKLISNLSSFPEAWCMTKKQFRQKSRRNFMGSW
ncbi:hypothetical protein HHK36_002323 [Tetracentron sinense]|uniref:F-box domain-containing protein n=1 Tax=Tetracentron sinense TaxID=13715 RepID=A0A835A5A9_TETSI|nr:hypothetical protein HHK36_002323 [Tetracentron sinense]